MTTTLPDVEPVAPLPPTPTPMPALPVVAEPAMAKPPVPPPPPTDCAKMPLENLPVVMIPPVLVTVTSLPTPPTPPLPPLRDRGRCARRDRRSRPETATAKPPLPPPPPIDCAMMPDELSKLVEMLPVLVTLTMSALRRRRRCRQARRRTAIDCASPIPQRQSSPLPPPPPTDCARMPFAPARHIPVGEARAGQDVAGRHDRDVEAVACRAALAAKTDRDAGVQPERKGYGRAAIAAAAADRIAPGCRRRRRALRRRRSVTVLGASPVRRSRRAFDRCGHALQRDRAGTGKAAIATATAHRLRQDAGRLIVMRFDVAGRGDRDWARVVARTAAAADGDRSAEGTGGEGAGDAETAVAAAAADRLRQDACRLFAVGGDVAVVGDDDVLADTAASAFAAVDTDAAPPAPSTEPEPLSAIENPPLPPPPPIDWARMPIELSSMVRMLFCVTVLPTFLPLLTVTVPASPPPAPDTAGGRARCCRRRQARLPANPPLPAADAVHFFEVAAGWLSRHRHRLHRRHAGNALPSLACRPTRRCCPGCGPWAVMPAPAVDLRRTKPPLPPPPQQIDCARMPRVPSPCVWIEPEPPTITSLPAPPLAPLPPMLTASPMPPTAPPIE